jgi:hypothetical protein
MKTVGGIRRVSLVASRAARDAGMEAVTQPSFFANVLALLSTGVLHGRTMTGEELRLFCLRRGVAPHHSNAWGAIVHHLVRKGFLEPTGEYRQMCVETSHARRTRVYAVR